MSMTIEQVNAAIAAFDERCSFDGTVWTVDVTDYTLVPPYASDIALLWPVVEQAIETWGDTFGLMSPRDEGSPWEVRVTPFTTIKAPTSTEALARAVAWVAGEMEKET